jgi:hypothetical protein
MKDEGGVMNSLRAAALDSDVRPEGEKNGLRNSPVDHLDRANRFGTSGGRRRRLLLRYQRTTLRPELRHSRGGTGLPH